MKVRFWGTRGSIATPGPATVRYGGNTSCTEVVTDSGTTVVLDCGTGARPLGAALMAESRRTGRPPSGHILIGHTHWDHIQGLPFFAPLFAPGARWHIYGPRGLGQSVASTLAGQMNHLYFPVSLEQLEADISYHDLVEGTLRVDDVTVRTQYLNHPALTLGYRLEAEGTAVVYVADHEPFDPSLHIGGDLGQSLDDARHVRFLRGADLVIHDTQYLAREYPEKIGWGHSTVEYAVAAARQAEVGHLVLFHHDPTHDDDDMDGVVALAEDLMGRAATVSAAMEGQTVEVTAPSALGPGGSETQSAESAESDDQAERRVVLAVTDRALAAAVRAAAAGQLPVVDLDDGGDITASSVVVVDHDDPDFDFARLVSGVDASTAVLAVTRRRPPLDGPSPVTDWLVWPATVNHLRVKLQAVLLGRACRWQNAPRPETEERRLSALEALAVLDTPREERFDRLTRLAREKLRVPIALVTLVDRERQWFKSTDGLDATETPRDESICAHAILADDVLQVPDLLLDDRFAELPAVIGPSRARFYAGAPLVMPGGDCVGTFCVVDYRPRFLDPQQLTELRRIADLVGEELLSSAPAAT